MERTGGHGRPVGAAGSAQRSNRPRQPGSRCSPPCRCCTPWLTEARLDQRGPRARAPDPRDRAVLAADLLALHTIAVSRMRYHQHTRGYADRRCA